MRLRPPGMSGRTLTAQNVPCGETVCGQVGLAAHDELPSDRKNNRMTQRLLDFLDALARTGGTRWYPPNAVPEQEQEEFQGEVRDLEEIQAEGYVSIRPHYESRSGERNVDQVQVEMLDGEGWLDARQSGDY